MSASPSTSVTPTTLSRNGDTAGQDAQNQSDQVLQEIDPEELKLPKLSSMVIVIVANLLLQISFFIIVSSSNEYAKHLGGDSTFSGVVIGIPTAMSALALIPLLKYDKGGYAIPLNVSCAASIIGHIIYACAYHADYLYLILIGRIVNGFGFTMWMYCKRYCSDPRIVGIRRRTTLASFLVMGQALGMSLGPFVGGLFYKIGFKNTVFNGFTSPGWVMAAVWCCFWICVRVFYEDVPENARLYADEIPLEEPQSTVPVDDVINTEKNTSKTSQTETKTDIPQESKPLSASSSLSSKLAFLRHKYKMKPSQWGVLACMCWFAMTCFFILGAWEASLPVFGASVPRFHWSPTAAGNFIALGAICAFPFLILNIFLIQRIEDRKILALGSCLGISALLVFLSLLRSGKINYGSVFMCWWAVALGFNMASTVPVSLLSKQLPPSWNSWTSMAIQYSMYTGRVTGAIWGGSSVRVGMMVYTGLEITTIGIGMVMFIILWDSLKAKKG